MKLSEVKEIREYIEEEYEFDVDIEVVNTKDEEYNLYFLDNIGDIDFVGAFSILGDVIVASMVTDFTFPLEQDYELYQFANEINTMALMEKAVVVFDSNENKLKFEINNITTYEEEKSMAENVDEFLAAYVFGVREIMEDNIDEMMDIIDM